jgi:hypothetical protein
VTASPDSYRWLSESELQNAGCVTVIAEADTRGVAGAFGFEEIHDSTPAAQDRRHPPEDYLGDWARVGAEGPAAIVFEDNGYQGLRPEVLRPASRASASGNAASICWNVNDEIHFSCSRRGKVVCSVELIGVEDELDELPKPLHGLAALCTDEGADLVAIGAAMVEEFTGVAFGPETFSAATARAMDPRPEDLRTSGVMNALLRYDAPDLVEAIAALDSTTQRRLAEWVSGAAIAEAGIADEPAVRLVAGEWGGDEPPVIPAAFKALLKRWDREASDWARRHDVEMDDSWDEAIESTYFAQRSWAGKALTYTSHPEAIEAALECTYSTMNAYQCSKTERGLTFIEDETGRHEVHDGPIKPERGGAFLEVVRHLLRDDSRDWSSYRDELPVPLTVAERQEAIRVDRMRQERGDFDTWQVEYTDDAPEGATIYFFSDE